MATHFTDFVIVLVLSAMSINAQSSRLSETKGKDLVMSGENKIKNTKNNKKADGKFASKHIKHDPQDESARAKNGLQNNTSNHDRTNP